MKKALVIGASGATGKLLVAELLNRNIKVVAIVRASSSQKSTFKDYSNYSEVLANVTEMSDKELSSCLADCEAVLSCLGHNLTFRGIFGEPKRLVANTISRISRVIELLKPANKIKVILMNTAGNSNRGIPEMPPLSQRIVTSILRFLLPPQVDNEQAADSLRIRVGSNHQFIEWVVVRPDTLVNETEVTAYKIHESPIRNVIFNAGSTSRINVADFMANLTADPILWETWRGKMPVIYNDA